MKIISVLLSLQIVSGTLTPFVLADGSQLFTYLANLDDKPPELTRQRWLDDRLSRELAAARWCLDGWEIRDQQESDGYIVLEGRCL